MTAQDLKNSILQLAMQGKLVEQRAEEGTAEELYRQIQEEKVRLIKEGKIKKEKPLPEISDDEIPFEIPDSWKWVRLGECLIIERGGSPRPIKEFITENSNGINWIKIGDTDKGSKYINSTKEKIIPEGMKKSRYVEKGDFLLSNSMSFGRPYILNVDGCIHDGWLVLKQVVEIFDKDYLYYLLSSNMVYIQFCRIVAGAVVNNLNSDKVAITIVPLPSIEEQKRIAAKIEELLPLVEQYDKAYAKLEMLNKKFPEDMKKSILQYAMQGKLVEQRAEEGTAEELYQQIQEEKQKLIKEGKIKKEKPLPEITEDEIPFEIPDSWKWVYLGDLFQHNTGKALNSSNRLGKKYKYITTSNLYWNRFELDNIKEMLFTDEELSKCTVQKGDLLICEGGDVGRSAIWDYEYEMRIQNHIHRLRAYFKFSVKFFYYVMYLYKHIGKIGGKGIGIKGLSSNALHMMIVPLPPLEEQKRIVSKIEELLSYI